VSRLTKFLRRVTGRTPEFSHVKSLQRLKSLGLEPRTIFDIGAYHGTWTRDAVTVYPAADYFLFEANSDHAAILNDSGRKWFNVALGSADLPSRKFSVPNIASSTGASFFPELGTAHSHSTVDLPTVRLDTLVGTQRLPQPDIMKLDVQGAEIEILRGADNALKACQAVIVETGFAQMNDGAPLMADVAAWLGRAGFFCVDIAETHRGKAGGLLQVDLVFVSEPLFRTFTERER
jgi:FkbM family methyltransferase